MPLDILAHDGRRVRVIVPAGMHPGMQLQAVMPPYAQPIAKLPTGKPVKMTELLQAVAGRLDNIGDVGKLHTILEIAARYKACDATYQQTLLTVAEVVGRHLLVQEICRLQITPTVFAGSSSSGTTSADFSSRPATARSSSKPRSWSESEPGP